MTRRFRLLSALSVFVALAWLSSGLIGQNRTGGTPSLAAGDWPHYTADMRGSKYSPLEQIDAVELRQARGRVALQDRQRSVRVPSTSSKARRWP